MPLNLRNTILALAKKPNETDAALFKTLVRGLIEIDILANSNYETIKEMTEHKGLFDSFIGTYYII